MGLASWGKASRSSSARVVAPTRPVRTADARVGPRTLALGDTVWLASVPTVLLVVLSVLLLGPVVGRTLLAPVHLHFWTFFQPQVLPEPVEQGRFLVSLVAPLLLGALTFAVSRARPRPTAAPTVSRLVVAIQALVFAFVVICLLQQRELFGHFYPGARVEPVPMDYFNPVTLVVSAAGTVAVVAAVRSTRLRTVWRRVARETSTRAIVAGAITVAAIAVWLLAATYTEGTIAGAQREVSFHLPFTMDETWAVLDGRTPLANFTAQYSSLWPYAFAAAMSVIGASLGVWIALALSTTGLGMLAIYATLRRVARSPVAGLLLFLPVLATSFFRVLGPLSNRYTFANYFGTFPMRYAGPSILLWVLARHLSGAAPRRAFPVFLLAGLVALNNLDAGAPALVATVVAVLWVRAAQGGQPRTALRRPLLEAAGGLAGAFAGVSALTLLRAGSLPQPSEMTHFSRLFALAGFAMYPMPTVGLHLVLYLTYLACFGVAIARWRQAGSDRLLTGVLVWSGVFGLGTGAYYVGRSSPDDLIALFFPWSLAVALLLIPALDALASARWSRVPPAAVCCVLGFLIFACSLAQTPTPWEQLRRLGHTSAPMFEPPTGETFVAEHIRRGERVVVFMVLGHQIAADLGVVNVSAYSNDLSMPASEALYETIARLRAAGGRKVFLQPELAGSDFVHTLEGAGFHWVAGETETGNTGLWVDEAR